MRVRRLVATSRADVLTQVRQLAPRCLVVDVEPLIAFWNTDSAALRQGVEVFLREIDTIAEDTIGMFATNSGRSTPIPPGSWTYRSSAMKPLRTAVYRRLPRPGIVIGDQVATDGLLAYRLGFTFIHYHPPGRLPLGPILMHHLGRPLTPLLFRPDRPVPSQHGA